MNWSYRFRNSLIEFFDQENMGLDTKITLLWQLEQEILMKVRLGVAVLKYGPNGSEIQLFLFQCQKCSLWENSGE